MSSNDEEIKKNAYLRHVEDLHDRIAQLSVLIKDPSMTPDMNKVTAQIDYVIEKLQEMKELDIPFDYSIPHSLLKWIDKPADNNPDVYYNIYLNLCEEINQIHKTRGILREHIVSRLETGLSSFLTLSVLQQTNENE